jgi:hypothetical protein
MSKGRPLIGTIKLPYQHVEMMKIAVARKRNSDESDGSSRTISTTVP